MLAARRVMALKLEIVLPGGKIEIPDVRSVVFQSTTGEMGVLPGHLAALALVDVGVLRVTTGEGARRFVTGQGLANITENQVRLLLHDLVAEEDIDEDEALGNHTSLAKSVAAPNWTGTAEGRAELLRELRFYECQLELTGVSRSSGGGRR